MEVDSMTEDSMDGSPPSLGSLSETTIGLSSIATVPTGPATPTPGSSKQVKKTPGKKLVTGYILYSSEVRRSVAERNPTSGFGEISRMVGQDVSHRYLKECTMQSRIRIYLCVTLYLVEEVVKS
jgi:hypothetical protein